MSTFDEWFGQREAAFATPGETDAEYTERAAKEAWNAALDELEGLTREWDRCAMVTPALQLRERIKELREES